MKRIIITSSLLLLLSCLASAAGSLSVTALRCEHLINPLGIDVDAPRLSWTLTDNASVGGQRQAAWHVLVASSPEKLAEGKADVWDSGIVQSQESHLVPYAGKMLSSGSDYYWKVRVYDNRKNVSEWSAVARFSTGLRSRSEWKGEWIKHPTASSEKHIWFRRHLNVSGSPSTTFAYVASLGYHELYVNGKKVDERVLAPNISRLDRRATYVTYDIAPMLNAGDNVIAVWYAAGWTRNKAFAPLVGQGLLVQINGNAAGAPFSLSSDNTWKTAESCSGNTGTYTFGDKGGMGGEYVDGRSPGIARWCSPGFDDSEWTFAQVTKPQAGNVDTLLLSAQMADPSRIVETLPAVRITDSIPGEWRVDMGKSFTGFVEASFDGLHAGDTVTIQVSNRWSTNIEFEQRQYYIARGEKGETFINRFNYVAGRYITITGLSRAPHLADIRAHAVSSAGRRTGYFSSSNRLFNQIYEADRRTYEMCHTEGVIVDCPNRERLGYGMEGAYMTTWGLGLPCFASAPYYVRNIRDWSDVQREDGRMNYVAPHINDMWGNSMAGAAPLNIAYELYYSSGDIRPLETALETGRRWIDFLIRHTDGDGLLKDYDTRNGFFLGEWLFPKHVQEFNEEANAVFFNNCAFVMTLDLYIRLSDIVGKSAALQPYRDRLASLRKAIHAKYYNREVNSYLSGDQVRSAFALFAGIVPDELKEAVLKRLTDDMTGEHPYFNIGSFTRYQYYHVLFAHPHFTDIIHDILSKRTWPGYGYFISKGEATWPETWEIDEDKSSAKIHTGNTGISAWFIKSLAGIEPSYESPSTAGYRSVIIRPHLPAKLDNVRAGVETPYGLVESAWRKDGKQVSFDISIPVNTSAVIILPNGKTYRVGSGKHSYTLYI
jgi:alpha-L-rhamnosidase